MVVNPSAQNALGHHTSYILVPGANALPYVAPNSPVRQRAGFINHHFWATRYNARRDVRRRDRIRTRAAAATACRAGSPTTSRS